MGRKISCKMTSYVDRKGSTVVEFKGDPECASLKDQLSIRKVKKQPVFETEETEE